MENIFNKSKHMRARSLLRLSIIANAILVNCIFSGYEKVIFVLIEMMFLA